MTRSQPKGCTNLREKTMATRKLRAISKEAKNGQQHWALTATNNRKIASGGETFHGRLGAVRSFKNMADKLRALTDEEYAQLLADMVATLK